MARRPARATGDGGMPAVRLIPGRTATGSPTYTPAVDWRGWTYRPCPHANHYDQKQAAVCAKRQHTRFCSALLIGHVDAAGVVSRRPGGPAIYAPYVPEEGT